MYELARELGLTNKETLDLCDALGVGVKSHSSSLVEAQADRVRRRAERDGLLKKNEEAPAQATASTETTTSKAEPAAPAAPKAAPAAKAPKTESATGAAQKVATAESTTETTKTTPTPVAKTEADAKSEPAPPVAPAASSVPSQAPKAPPAPKAAPPRPDRPAPKGESGGTPLVTSSGGAPSAPRPPAPERRTPPKAPPAARPAGQAPPARPPMPPAPRPSGPPPGMPPGAPRPPMSASGKPIPPPPGPPVSRSGKPIPPPPGLGGRGPAPAPARGRGGPGRTGAPGGPGPSRTSAPSGTGPQAPSGGRPSMPGSPPPGGGRPGGRPGGGPPTQSRRPPRRRKGRRRRSSDELQPMDAPTYTPQDAAVPTGTVVVERASSPQDLGPKLNRTAADVVRFLMQQGEMVTATQSLSDEMIELFAVEVGADIRLVDPGEEQEVELLKMLEVDVLEEAEADDEDAPLRSPVVTVMGHVDHGKTTLLDRIRNANVVSGEAGGITQHIGAYQVERQGRLLTFIDTPGHEAFTAMRARGANATDIVILVVAADDGVMPQTLEALSHARAAGVPIVVAITKIDRENADPNRIMQQISEHDLVPESWGGDTIVVEVSAPQNLGIDELLDNLLVIADLEELRATPDGRARGIVLESHLDIGRGAVASVLVQRGTLRVGDPLVAGAAWGRVRALINDRGEQVKEALPSTPVEVLGLSDVAQAGDDFIVAPDERRAAKVAETREHWQRLASQGRDAHAMSGGARLEDIFSQIQAGEVATLNLIVKADVNGSLEALSESLKRLERDEVKLSFVHRGVGGISQYDIQLAAASNATIIGFNVRPDRNARELAATEGVEIRTYEVIYKALEDIENAVVGMLAPEFEEVITGDAEVREIFRVPRIGAVAGCYVTNGVITRGSLVRFLREGTVIWKGEISSLRRFKDDVREVAAGYECGIGLSDFQDLKPGDVIETYEEREIART